MQMLLCFVLVISSLLACSKENKNSSDLNYENSFAYWLPVGTVFKLKEPLKIASMQATSFLAEAKEWVKGSESEGYIQLKGLTAYLSYDVAYEVERTFEGPLTLVGENYYTNFRNEGHRLGKAHLHLSGKDFEAILTAFYRPSDYSARVRFPDRTELSKAFDEIILPEAKN